MRRSTSTSDRARPRPRHRRLVGAAGGAAAAARTGRTSTSAADDEPTLAEHLDAQVGAVAATRGPVRSPAHLIGQLDEAGYLPRRCARSPAISACRWPRSRQALAVVQSLDPTGVGARTLGECLALQAKEADRYDPCMARLIDNLDLVARGEFARLKRMCDVDDEDFADMLAELRGYDPKPGLQVRRRRARAGGARHPGHARTAGRLGRRAQRGDAAAPDRQPPLLRRAARRLPRQGVEAAGSAKSWPTPTG